MKRRRKRMIVELVPMTSLQVEALLEVLGHDDDVLEQIVAAGDPDDLSPRERERVATTIARLREVQELLEEQR